MSKFNAEQHRIETASALDRIIDTEQEDRHAAYVGLDVHKETIAVAARTGLVAEQQQPAPVGLAELGHQLLHLLGLVGDLPAIHRLAPARFRHSS